VSAKPTSTVDDASAARSAGTASSVAYNERFANAMAAFAAVNARMRKERRWKGGVGLRELVADEQHGADHHSDRKRDGPGVR
jgi:hypothetical protein